jgi:hypothetical protein
MTLLSYDIKHPALRSPAKEWQPHAGQKDVYVTPENTLFEGPSHLIDDSTDEVVGVAVSESMDVRIMNNAPGGPNQH